MPAPAPSAVSCGPGGSALRGAWPNRTFSRLIFLGFEGAIALLLVFAEVVVVADGAVASGAGVVDGAVAAAGAVAGVGVVAVAGVGVTLLTVEKRPPRSKRCFSRSSSWVLEAHKH